MATLAELQALQTRYQAEIKRRKGNAPEFTKKLQDVEQQIKSLGTSGTSSQNTQTFNADSYLKANPDIAAEISRLKSTGDPRSPAEIALAHWTSNGQAEGRPGAFGDGLAGSIDTDGSGLTPDDAAAIDRAKGIIGVGEDFGRRIGDEFYGDGALGRVDVVNSPEELAAMEAAKEMVASLGNRSGTVNDIVNTQTDILGQARELSPLELEALGIARGSLAGLNAPEMEALRSQARANIQGQMQADARALAKAQARNQVFGAAATAQNRLLNQDRIKETRNLERDLLVKNIDIKQAAQNAFTSLSTATEANRAGRTNAASGQLANTVLTDENNRNTAKVGAVANQGNMATGLADRLRKLEEYNLGNAAAERAGRVSSIFGGIGTITDQRGLLAGEKFGLDQWSESKEVQDQILEEIRKALNGSKKALG